jgi:protein-L-isoaspartate O-methyltransferase
MVQTAPMYGHHLVATIERELGRPLMSSVREAFLRVPRHLFIPFYYEGKQLKTPLFPMMERTGTGGLHRSMRMKRLSPK